MISVAPIYPALVGINAGASPAGLPADIAAGSTVRIFVQRDDIAAQTALGLLELDDDGNPTDGIREDTFEDDRLSEDVLIATCDARLAVVSRPITSAAYDTYDTKSVEGRTVSIDITLGGYDPTFYDPTFYNSESWGLSGDFIIQSADITPEDDLTLRISVKASSAEFTLTDFLRRGLIG